MNASRLLKHTITKRALVTLALTATLAGAASAARPAKIVAAKRALAQASNQASPEALIAARAAFEALSAAEPKSAVLHYWVAYADWRLVPRLDKDPKLGERYCRDGLTHVEQALKRDPTFADAIAIKASLQGLFLRFDPNQMMTLGPEMMQHMARAGELAPKNPRVRFLDGINTLHAPAFAGGGPEPALAKFKQAIGLFAEAGARDSTGLDWGHDDAYLWAGRCAMKLEDFEAARGFFQKALELNPNDGWVRDGLLPEAEQAMAAKGKP